MRTHHFRTNTNSFAISCLKKRISKERKLTISIMIYTAIFIFSWLPYSAVSIYRVFFGEVSPFYASLPAMFAKSSMVTSTISYLLTNSHVKRKLMPVKQNKTTNTERIKQKTNLASFNQQLIVISPSLLARPWKELLFFLWRKKSFILVKQCILFGVKLFYNVEDLIFMKKN